MALATGTLALLRPKLEGAWCRAELSGRLTEISGRGCVSPLSAAAALLLEAQAAGEPCAWITCTESSFFPPDLVRFGIDLGALPVVFVKSAQAAARAAARLVRSGAFGLLLLDLGEDSQVSIALQGRLTGLALKNDAAVVLLTQKSASAPSVGSMVSLRAEPRRSQAAEALYKISLTVLKDKRRGPGWFHEEVMLGPDGLR
jgi:recombination protein RecA